MIISSGILVILILLRYPLCPKLGIGKQTFEFRAGQRRRDAETIVVRELRCELAVNLCERTFRRIFHDGFTCDLGFLCRGASRNDMQDTQIGRASCRERV